MISNERKHAVRVAQKATKLSKAAKSVWGKTKRSADTTFWLPLYRHLADTALVSAKLYDEYLPDAAMYHLQRTLMDPDDAKVLAIFAAAAHDIGKASPVFLASEDDYVNELNDTFMAKNGLHVPRGLDRTILRHEVVSAYIIQRYLKSKGVSDDAATSLAIIAGSHHGHVLSHELIAKCEGREDILGVSDPNWAAVQQEILDYAAVISGADKRFLDWSDLHLETGAENILIALTVMADWGSSGQFYCNLSLNSNYYDIDVDSAAEHALGRLAEVHIPQKWQSNAPNNAGVEFFQSRFGFEPRPLQRATLEAANRMDGPGLLIVEGPMGEGKTEAALAAAEVIAKKVGASGIFFALPTIATSDAIFGRTKRWMNTLPGDQDGLSMYLSHSRSALNGKFSELLDASSNDYEGAHVNPWLSRGAKLGVLSNFVVGTIDQVLVSALATNHVALRHLAMMNKVVILDEVHAYDAYMSVFLGRTLYWMGYYGIPILILSATLPAQIRKDVVASYNGGIIARANVKAMRHDEEFTFDMTIAQKRKSTNIVGDLDLKPLNTIGYPLITVVDSNGIYIDKVKEISSKKPTELMVKTGGGNNKVLAPMLERELIHGGCIGVFRNTVARAQEAYDELSMYFQQREKITGDKVIVMLMHSRFIGLDRAVRESKLLERIGKNYSKRPKRLIVIGTQVIEQSLDIDFDMAVTDIAPIDIIMQRAGRVHRHQIPTRPRVFATPRLYIAGVTNWKGEENNGVPGVNHAAEAIYHARALRRSVNCLREFVNEEKRLRLPKDISRLVRKGYGARVRPPESWAELWKNEEIKWNDAVSKKQNKADANYLLPTPEIDLRDWQQHINKEIGENESAALAQVRDIEDQEEILILNRQNDGSLTILDGDFEGAGLTLDETERPDINAALAAAASVIRLRSKEFEALVASDCLIDTNTVSAWNRTSVLKHKYILPIGMDNRLSSAHFSLIYSHDKGLEMKVNNV